MRAAREAQRRSARAHVRGPHDDDERSAIVGTVQLRQERDRVSVHFTDTREPACRKNDTRWLAGWASARLGHVLLVTGVRLEDALAVSPVSTSTTRKL